MAPSPGNTNPLNPPPFDLGNLSKPSSSPYPTPPASYPPPAGPFLNNQYNQQLYAPPGIAAQPSPVTQPRHQQQEVPSSSSVTNLHPQRTLSYPTSPLNLQSPRANHNPGTHILALLNNNGGGGREGSVADQEPSHQLPVVNTHEIARVPSCKLPRGRRLTGEHAVYDVDVRLHGEIQPHLEVTPITKYGSDPQLVVGRQIAVNKVYICYGLKGGNIRVLNINTALRALFRGHSHSQRVTDMAFFAKDVHLLASVSLDGKVFVWKISEGSEGDDQPQITGNVALALQILGEEDTKHPRVCWHSHKQEFLVVSIGKHVLLIDTTKVGRGQVFSAEAPIQCPLDQLIDGVKILGKHDGEVTDLSMCQWMITRLVSSSVDGTVKIWKDFKTQPVAVLRPHDGYPVSSSTFVTPPERPDHVILITGGPLNREMKIWVPAGEEGWLLSADSESWNCTQKLDLKSSTEPRAEEAFFNQVIALSEAGLLLLANAKRNAIYAVHLDYSTSPVDTKMDYLSEFTVTMPILSFVGANDPPEEAVVKVFCVQTQAIQQYTLDLCLCSPPCIEENVGLEKSDSSVSREANLVDGSEPSGMKLLPSVDLVPKPSILVNTSKGSASGETTTPAFVPSNGEPKTSGLLSETSGAGSAYATATQLPISPRLSSKLSGYHTPVEAFEQVEPRYELSGKAPSADHSVDRQTLEDRSSSEEKNITPDDDESGIRNPPSFFKHPTHLVKPSELSMGVSSAEASVATEDKRNRVNNDASATEIEASEAGEAKSTLLADALKALDVVHGTEEFTKRKSVDPAASSSSTGHRKSLRLQSVQRKLRVSSTRCAVKSLDKTMAGPSRRGKKMVEAENKDPRAASSSSYTGLHKSQRLKSLSGVDQAAASLSFKSQSVQRKLCSSSSHKKEKAVANHASSPSKSESVQRKSKVSSTKWAVNKNMAGPSRRGKKKVEAENKDLPAAELRYSVKLHLPISCTYKVILAGPPGAGKTTFARRHLGGLARKMSFGEADIYSMVFSTSHGNILVQAWDGTDKEKNLIRADCAILMVDVSASMSVSTVSAVSFQRRLFRSMHIPMLLCGTKLDLLDVPVSRPTFGNLVPEKVSFLEVSALANYNVDQFFLILARLLTGDKNLQVDDTSYELAKPELYLNQRCDVEASIMRRELDGRFRKL